MGRRRPVVVRRRRLVMRGEPRVLGGHLLLLLLLGLLLGAAFPDRLLRLAGWALRRPDPASPRLGQAVQAGGRRWQALGEAVLLQLALQVHVPGLLLLVVGWRGGARGSGGGGGRFSRSTRSQG